MSKFEKVKPEEIPQSERPKFNQDGSLGTVKSPKLKEVSHELDVEFLDVYDADGNKIGRMPYPTEFCEPETCSQMPFSYHRFSPELPIWVHSVCWKPRREYWDSVFKDHVNPEPGVKFPWEI